MEAQAASRHPRRQRVAILKGLALLKGGEETKPPAQVEKPAQSLAEKLKEVLD
jgi:hypothetical protein